MTGAGGAEGADDVTGADDATGAGGADDATGAGGATGVTDAGDTAGAGGSFFTGYDTYRSLYNAVASTWVTEATDSGARVSSVGTAAPEYRVTVLADDEEMDTVRAGDWQTDEEAVFQPLAPGDYLVTVEARPRGDEDAAPKGNWMEIHVD
jgi:hypothetical protein